MKAHFGIAENRDGSPGLARKSGSQEIIDGSAGAFIIRGSRDARDASVSVESQGAVLLISSGSHGSGSSLVLPFCRPFIEQMHQVRFGWFRMNGGGQQLRAHFRLFIFCRRKKLLFCASRAPPQWLECPPTRPEIALREFCSFCVFVHPPIGWSVLALGSKIPQCFCVFVHPQMNQLILLLFCASRAPPQWLECPPTRPEIALREFCSFCVFVHPLIGWSVLALGSNIPQCFCVFVHPQIG